MRQPVWLRRLAHSTRTPAAMLTNTKQLESAMSEILKDENFQKKGNSWYMDGADSICVINLQKSDWGGQYYVNLGVSLKCLESSPFPKEHKCHIRSRLCELVEDQELLSQSLNLEDHSFQTELTWDR
jgi:hypothetical protein